MSRASFVSASLAFGLSFALIACGGDDDDDGNGSPDGGTDAPMATGWSMAPSLPMAVANNAVAAVRVGGDCQVVSALGIGGAFTPSDITNAAFRWIEGDAAWETIAPAPGPPRVAANAVGLAGNIYLLGGYTVSAGGAEASSDRLDMFNTATGMWEPKAPVPIPIDDTVAVAWQERYMVVISGWSNTANVDAVQIYDSQTNMWMAGTPFPGTPAFGHAGGIDDNTIVIIDGAASTPGFPIINQTWVGTLDPAEPTTIAWTDQGQHPGPSRYRAAGGPFGDQVWLHGGTATPYNFDGLRYDNNQPATPLASTLAYSSGGLSEPAVDKPTATMDHRSMASCADNRIYSVGGMVAGPTATSDVWRFQGDGS